MIDLERAKKKAVELSGRNDINYCVEYTKGFVFGVKDEVSFGGELPIVILKDTGKAVNMLDFIDLVSDGVVVKEHQL